MYEFARGISCVHPSNIPSAPQIGYLAVDNRGWGKLLVFFGVCVENADFIRLYRVFDALESDGKDRFVPVQVIRFRMAWKTQNPPVATPYRFESGHRHHVVADFVSFATTFFIKTSSLIHFVAHPFKIEPAPLGFDFVFGTCGVNPIISLGPC